MMTGTSTICVDLVVQGDFDPTEFAARSGLAFTASWRKGDSSQGTLIQHKRDGLLLSTGEQAVSGVEELILSALNHLEAERERFIAAIDAFNADVSLDCCVWLAGGVMPALNFSKMTMKRMSDLGLSMDIDVIPISDT